MKDIAWYFTASNSVCVLICCVSIDFFIKLSPDRILSRSVSPSDSLSLPMHPQRRLVSTPLNEKTHGNMMTWCRCPALASDWCRCLRIWTLGLFCRDSASNMQTGADHPWQANLRLGETEPRVHGERCTLMHLITWLIGWVLVPQRQRIPIWM